MHQRYALSAAALAASCLALSAPAVAQDLRTFDIPPGSLGDALNLYATQSDQQILFSGDLVAGRTTNGLVGRYTPAAALDRLLAGTGLAWAKTRPGVLYLRRAVEEVRATAELEDIVVTGSLLRASGELASPVLILDRDALDRRGFATVAETLTALPQNYAGSATPLVQLAGTDRGGSNSVYATGVNLRGLGPSSTLVLVNGRRLAATGMRGEFQDVSALPSSAVERVDVLLDGASALYGSDAVAGVVNVIMRRSFEGQETRVRGAAAAGGAEDLMLSHLAGRAWSSGSAYLSYEYQETNGLSSYDRPYTRDGDLRPFGGTDHRSFYSAPGNIVAFDASRAGYVTQYAIRPGSDGIADTPNEFVAGAANLQSTTLGADLVPAIERHSAYGRVRQALGDRIDLSADVRYSRREHEIAGAASAGVFTVTAANPHFVSPTGAAAHTLGYAFLDDLGPTRAAGASESLGLTAGATLELPGRWSLDGYLAWAQERGEAGVYNRVHSRFLNEALGNVADDPATPFRTSVDGYLNLFGSGAANARPVLDFIGSGYTLARDESRATSFNLLLEGPLLRLPAGDLDIAVGAQHRTEIFDTGTVSFAATPDPVANQRPRRERSIAAVFAEARLPLVGEAAARPGLRRLDLSIAGRHERYDDFGTTTNPKVGVVWSPMDDLVVRSSWGTSFRAAALPQIYDAPGATGVILNRADGVRTLTLSLVGGNPDLRPETAETFTLGFDYARADRLRLSANYFDTRFTDRIARPVNENAAFALIDPALAPFVRFINPSAEPSDRALLESYAGLPGFPSLYPLDTYGAIIDSRWVNAGAVKVRGIDASAGYPVELRGGRLMLEASASWILDFETRNTPTATVREVSGSIGYPVEIRARSGFTWTSGDLGLGAHWNHVGAYEDFNGRAIDAWDTVDAQLSWSPQAGRFEGVRIALSVNNLFDTDPPFYDSPTGYGFDPGQASLLGRVVALQLIRRW